MREIVKPDGTVYATVAVDEKSLTIWCAEKNYSVVMDSRIIPQLAAILKEAEFFKNI